MGLRLIRFSLTQLSDGGSCSHAIARVTSKPTGRSRISKQRRGSEDGTNREQRLRGRLRKTAETYAISKGAFGQSQRTSARFTEYLNTTRTGAQREGRCFGKWTSQESEQTS